MAAPTLSVPDLVQSHLDALCQQIQNIESTANAIRIFAKTDLSDGEREYVSSTITIIEGMRQRSLAAFEGTLSAQKLNDKLLQEHLNRFPNSKIASVTKGKSEGASTGVNSSDTTSHGNVPTQDDGGYTVPEPIAGKGDVNDQSVNQKSPLVRKYSHAELQAMKRPLVERRRGCLSADTTNEYWLYCWSDKDPCFNCGKMGLLTTNLIRDRWVCGPCAGTNFEGVRRRRKKGEFWKE